MSAITLRSGKQCQEPQPANEPAQPHSTQEKDDDKNVKSKLPNNFYAGDSKEKQYILLPFPPRAISNKKMKETEKEILETFRKVEVNIPLLDAMKQIPIYAKFLKKLCTNKWKLKGSERINMGRNVSALIGKSVPQILEKCHASIIGNSKFDNAMLDLGASSRI